MIHRRISVSTPGKGLVEITSLLEEALSQASESEGMLAVFCRHTSCSLVLMENAEPSARRDLERYLDRLVPDEDAHFTHTSEGPDDMPSHIKMALTRSSELIPFSKGRLLLGTWQGVFLWEHRRHPHQRELVITVWS